jgi:hypothetical protein
VVSSAASSEALAKEEGVNGEWGMVNGEKSKVKGAPHAEV